MEFNGKLKGIYRVLMEFIGNLIGFDGICDDYDEIYGVYGGVCDGLMDNLGTRTDFEWD